MRINSLNHVLIPYHFTFLHKLKWAKLKLKFIFFLILFYF